MRDATPLRRSIGRLAVANARAARVRVGDATSFARGVEVEVELDEEKYAGTGVFLFAAILERFLGLYTSINSFTQTVARVRQREGLLKRWPPRCGEIQLL